MPFRRQQATLITTAPRSRPDEIQSRQRRYMLTMALRTLCFVAAIALFHGTVQLIAMVASLVLPWIAVVVANGGPAKEPTRPSFHTPPAAPALPPAGPAAVRPDRVLTAGRG